MDTFLDEILKGEDPKKNANTTQRTLLDDVLSYNKPNEHATDIQLGQTGVGESKYDTEITTNNIDDLEYIRGERQSGLAQVGLGVIRAGTKAALEIAKTPAYLYSLGEYTLKNTVGEGQGLDEALDNAWLNALEGLESKTKEALPVYHSYKSGKGGLLDNIASTSFWSSEGADGVGYLIGMMAPAYAIRAAGMAPKLMQLGLSSKVAGGVELGTQTLVNTSIESLAEAKQVADNLKLEGADPEKIADAARNTFYANMGVLLIPNLIMNKNLLGRYGRDKSILDNFRDPITGRLVTDPIAKKKLIKQIGKAIALNTASEGFLEEGSQTTIQNYETDKALGRTNKEWLEGVASEYIDTLNTLEGQKSILLGAVLGSLAGTIGAIREKRALDKELAKGDIQSMMADNFEGFSVSNDIYRRNEDGSVVINEITNQPELDLAKTAQALIDYSLENKYAQYRDLAVLNNDKTVHDRIVHDQFVRYAMPFIEKGEIGIEVLNEHIDNASKTNHLINEEAINKSKNLEFEEASHKANLKNKIKDLQKIYESTLEQVDNLNLDKTIDTKNNNNLSEFRLRLINTLFQESSKQLFYQEKLKELNNEILSIQNSPLANLPQIKESVARLGKEVESIQDLLKSSQEAYNTVYDPKNQQIAYNFYTSKQKELKELTTEKEKELNKPVTEDDAKSADVKVQLANDLVTLYETEDFTEFKKLYNKVSKNPFLSKEDKKALIEKYNDLSTTVTNQETSELDDLFNTPEQTTTSNIDKKALEKELDDLIQKDVELNYTERQRLLSEGKTYDEASDIMEAIWRKTKDGKRATEIEKILNNLPTNKNTLNTINDTEDIEQDSVSEFTNVNTADNETESDQSPLDKTDNNLSESTRAINLRNNVVMMHLFNHYFNQKRFSFRRDEEGFPQLDNNSNLDIEEINSIQIGDGVFIKLVDLNKEQNSLYEDQKKQSLKNKGVKETDFDNLHLGIYSNDKLIGFIQQPHAPSDKQESIDLRNDLIAYRKAVIAKIQAGEDVIEEIIKKDNGNLYTKLNDNGRVDAIYDVLDPARDRQGKDLMNGINIFVHSDGQKLTLKEFRSTPQQKKEIQDILDKYKNYGRKGQVFQLVKDLNESWALIPVYSSLVNDETVTKVMSNISKYTNNTDLNEIIKTLNTYIYTSKKRQASLNVNNDLGEITFQVNTNTYSLTEINNNPSRRALFIEDLKTQRQNIDIRKINTKDGQKDLRERSTLITNVTTYKGEYFVQPYIEYSHNLAPKETTELTKNEETNLESPQLNTDTVSTTQSLLDEADRLFGDIDSLNDENALSRNKDIGSLNRKTIEKWLKKNLPQLTLSDITNIADLKANLVDSYGLYKDLTIYLFNEATNKTAYHEAFHGVFRNLLNKNEKHAIMQEAIEKYEAPKVEDLKRLQEGLSKDYTAKQLSYLWYEERLADDFKEFADTYNKQGFFGKIKEFFNKILEFFGLFTRNFQNNIDDIFYNINAGNFASRSPKVSRPDSIDLINRPYEVFNDEYAYSKELDKEFGSSLEKSKLVTKLSNQFLAMYQEYENKGQKVRPLFVYQKIQNLYTDFLNKVMADYKAGKPIPSKREIDYARKVIKNYVALTKEIANYLDTRQVNAHEDIIQTINNTFVEEEHGDTEFVTSLRSQTTKGLGEWTDKEGLSSASARLKMFLSSIPVLNKDGSNKKDIYGVEEFYDFNKLYYYIERNLVGLYTLDKQINRLKELSINLPEMSQVVIKLSIKTSNITQEQFEALQNDFKTNFSKQQLAYSLVKFDTNSATGEVTFRIIDANRENLAIQIFNQWQDNLLDTNKDIISEINQEGELVIYGTKKAQDINNAWEKTNKSNKPLDFNNTNTILNKIGIEMSSNVLHNLIDTNNTEFKKSLTTVLDWYSNTNFRERERDGRNALKTLVQFEINGTFNSFTSSFNSVENKNIYTVQLPSFTSKLLAKLQSEDPIEFENIIEEFRKDPYYKHSNLLNDLDSDEGFRLNGFSLSYLDGLKDEKGESLGSKFTSMTPKDYMSMEIALFQNKGVNEQREISDKISKYVYITPSDKTMCMIFDSKQYDVTLEDNGREVNIGSDILGNFYNVFLQEAYRIRHNMDIKNKVLSQELPLSSLLEHYHVSKGNYSTLTKYALKQLKNEKITDSEWLEIEKLFDGQAFRFNNYFKSENKQFTDLVTSLDTTLDNLENALEEHKDSILNTLRKELNAEIGRVRKEMYSKGLIIENKDKQIVPISIEVSGKNAEEISYNTKKLIASYALNSWLQNIELSNLFNGDIALYKPKDLQKRTYHSQSMITNNNFISSKIRTMVIKDVESSSPNTDLLKSTLEKQGLSKDLIDSIVSSYEGGINVTDAQVHILPSFYKKIGLSRGTWNDLDQLAYDILEGIVDPKTIDPSLRVRLGAYKPFYFGNRFDEELGIQRYEQVKCAMIPLFKKYIEFNPLMAQKRVEMEADNIDMLAHESSFKAAIGFRTDITSSNGTVIELDTDNFGIQVDNPEHILDSENDSMRQLKMLLVGSIDINKTYKGISGEQLRDEILKMESENIRESLNDLKDKINVKTNLEFANFIKEMITKRGATINIEELLNIENGDFVYPLDNGNLSTQVENMISSIFTNNVIKQSFNVGGSGVQATSLGVRWKDLTTEEDLLRQELRWIKPSEDGSTIEYAEAIMPAWSKEFFNKDGFLKDINTVPDSIKELIMYRIPTEGLHSMLPVRVVKFLPETMGNFILLPYEVTTQLGADFDFDKVYFIGREFYENLETGELTAYTYSDDIKQRYSEYMDYTNINKLPQLDFKDFEELPVDQQYVRPSRNNKIIDNYLHLLSSPENLQLLITKSGFDELAYIKDKFFKHEDKVEKLFFSSVTQRDYKERNHTGISLKGQWALHVSGHSYSTLMNISTANYDKKTNLLDKTLSINFNGENKTNFSSLYTVNGSLISDKIASILAGVLDDIKNPLLSLLGINNYTTDVAATIIRSGYNLETAIKFVAQPSIKHLSRILSSNENKIKAVGQNWENIDNLVTSYNKQLSDLINELTEEQKEALSSDIESIDDKWFNIEESELDSVLNDYKDQKDIDSSTLEDKVKFYIFQIKVLKSFANIKVISDELININKFFGINKEVGPNIEDILTKQELLNNIQDSEILSGFDLDKIPTLKATWEAHNEALDFFKNYFPYSTEYYNTIKNYIVSNQTTKDLSKIPVDDRNAINSFIRMYTDSKFNEFSNIPAKYEKLFVYLPDTIKRIKNTITEEQMKKPFSNITYGDLKNNLFLDNLTVRYDKTTKMSFIVMKGNRLDLQVKNNLIESFTLLYNNPNTKALAKDLIDYSFASTGFYTGLKSYSSLISPTILKDLGYTDYRKNLIYDLTEDNEQLTEEDKERIMDQFIRNFPKTAQLTKVFDSEMFSNVDPKKILEDTLYTNLDLIDSYGRANDILLWRNQEGFGTVKYIRVYDKVAKRSLLYKNEEGTAKYNRISYLGKKGFMIEVDSTKDIQRSFLKDNNPTKTAKIESPSIVDEQSNEYNEPTTESDFGEVLNQDNSLDDMFNQVDDNTDNTKGDNTESPTNEDNNLPNNIKKC